LRSARRGAGRVIIRTLISVESHSHRRGRRHHVPDRPRTPEIPFALHLDTDIPFSTQWGVVKLLRSRRYLPWLYEGVYGKASDLRHLQSVRRLGADDPMAFEHEYLYSCLSILDSKAQSLMSFDAIILAASSIALGISPRPFGVGDMLVVIALVMSGLSSSLCLFVVWIYWTETSQFEDENEVFLHLLRIRNARTIAYRISWVAAQLSGFILILGVILAKEGV
jgi:hypothetical protein